MNRADLIRLLPEYRDQWVMLNPDQDVRDIIDAVIVAHKENGELYDRIAGEFDHGGTREVCSEIFYFLKNNIRYDEETDDDQTVSVPQGILARGVCDCKGYAGFAGGILDALNRRGRKIDWNYRFASYRLEQRTPHHVFVVVRDRGEEVWIDPIPGIEGKVPVWQQDQKCKAMSLRKNIAGIGDDAAQVVTQSDLEAALAEVDTSIDITEDQYNAIALLLNTRIIDEQGVINQARMNEYAAVLQGGDLDQLMAAYNEFNRMSQAVGNFFSELWRGVKTVSFAIPRNAFLACVAINLFGYATKLDKVMSMPDTAKKLTDKWYSLGGSLQSLQSAIDRGKVKKGVITGTGNQIGDGGLAAILASAAACIAAVMPLVASLLKSKNVPVDTYAAEDAAAASAGVSATGNPVMDFVKNNPIVAFGGAALLVYLLLGKNE